MPTCRDAIDVLRAYLDGEMPAEEKAALEEHLDGCNPCVEFVKTYRLTPELCRKALQTKMPQDLADSLNAFLRKNTNSA
jgi:anti-sigma factor (TIGR02949 family)